LHFILIYLNRHTFQIQLDADILKRFVIIDKMQDKPIRAIFPRHIGGNIGCSGKGDKRISLQ